MPWHFQTSLQKGEILIEQNQNFHSSIISYLADSGLQSIDQFT